MNALVTKTGLKERDIQTIKAIFQQYPVVTKVYLFGSRAMGNYKKGSDIDFAIMNEGERETIISKIKGEFEDSSLPYFVDLVNYPGISHTGLREHIERVGIEFYSK